MKTDVEELSPTRVKLTIEVPFSELKASLDKAYKEVSKQVRIPGFRPGHVPPRVIDQRLGRGVVLEQAVNDAVPQLYGKALEDNDVRALGQPDLEITQLDDGQQLAFTAEVDIQPKFELPDIDGLPVTVDNADRHPGRGGGVHRRPAGALRVAAGRRPPGGGGRLRVHRPVRLGGRQAGRGRAGERDLLRGRQRLRAGRPGRGADRDVGRRRQHLHGRAGGRGTRRGAGRGRGDRAQRQGQGAARAGRRVRAVGERVRHARRVPGRDPHPAGIGQAHAAGGPGPGPGARGAAGPARHPAAGAARRLRDRTARALTRRAAGAGRRHQGVLSRLA